MTEDGLPSSSLSRFRFPDPDAAGAEEASPSGFVDVYGDADVDAEVVLAGAVVAVAPAGGASVHRWAMSRLMLRSDARFSKVRKRLGKISTV